MAHYIDKDVLVAKIEKKIEHNTEWRDSCETLAFLAANEAVEEDKQILSIINSLEVKEVDLDYIKEELDRLIGVLKPNGDFGWGTLYNVATHFFELGLKVQKGE